MLPSQKMFFISLPAILLFIILIASSHESSAHSAATSAAHDPAVVKKEGRLHVQKKPAMWQKQPWMNHGSDRGPRKHLVNPSLEHPLEVPEQPL